MSIFEIYKYDVESTQYILIACCNALYVIICEISKICKTCYKCGSTTVPVTSAAVNRLMGPC